MQIKYLTLNIKLLASCTVDYGRNQKLDERSGANRSSQDPAHIGDEDDVGTQESPGTVPGFQSIRSTSDQYFVVTGPSELKR
jgi:hypothetical protein